MWISQKSQKRQKFRNYIWMSSYWDEFLRLQMGSLGVLDVFCTVFECATTSRSKFKFLSIFAIFDFWFVDFHHSTIEMSTIFHLWVPKYFFQKVSSCNSFRKKMYSLVCIISFPTAILVFSPIFHISTCELIFICGFIIEYSTGPEISYRKV